MLIFVKLLNMLFIIFEKKVLNQAEYIKESVEVKEKQPKKKSLL